MDSPDYYYHPSAGEEITYEPSRWSTEQTTIIKTAQRAGFSMWASIGVAITFFWALRLYLAYASKWRQEQHMLNLRRRHGIPDSDKRPFEIAYQQAVLARRDRERAVAEASRSGEPLPPSRPSSVQPQSYQSQSQNLHDSRRYREERSVSASIRSRHHSTQSSQMIRTDSYSSLQPSSQPQAGNNVFRDTGSYAQVHVHRPSTPLSRTNSEDWAARYAPATSAPAPAPEQPRRKRPMTNSQRPNENGRVIPTIITTAPTPIVRRSRKRLNLDEDDDRENRNMPNGKRSRIEGREKIDGDEDATWVKAMPVVTRKSIKRSASPVADSDSRSKRGKKSKPVESKHQPMDMDSVSSSNESRGRKRPRHSTVAEDDRQSDVQRGADRRKKGRMVPELTETPSTLEDETLLSESDGQEMDVNFGQDESGPTTIDDDEEPLDYDPETMCSIDPRCGGRAIGEEWEHNEREYKVGPNGKRLRKVLVKEARRKYNMPTDSQHPDANLKVEVVVEQWVTDDEHRNLKNLGQLGWQDSPAVVPPTDSRKSIPFEGKPLIWGGAANRIVRTRTASRATPLGTPSGSPATVLSRLPSESFSPISTTNSRRVGSPGAPMWMMIPGSRRKNGIYSDWEKQGLEAESILKMRQKLKVNAAAKAAAEAAPAPLPITSALFPSAVGCAPVTIPAAAPTDEKKTVRFAETPAVSDKPSTPSLFSWPSATSNASTTAAAATTPATMEAPKPAFSFNAPATTTPAAPTTNFFNPPAPTANANGMTTEPTVATTTPAIPNFFANTTTIAKPTEVKPPTTSMFDFSKPAASATPATTPGFSFNTVNAGSTPAVTDTNKPFTFGPSTTPATAPTSTNPFFNTTSSTPSNAMETTATSQTPAAALPTTANTFFSPAAASAQLPQQPKIPNFFSNPAQPAVATSTPAAQPFSFSSTPAATSTTPATASNSLLSRLGTNEAPKPPSVFSWPQTSATNGATDPTKPAAARPTASSFFSPLPAPAELPKPAATTKSPFFNGIDTAALGLGKPSVSPATPMATESKPAFTFGTTSTTPATKGASFAFGTPSTTPAVPLSTTPTTTPAAAAKPAWGGPKFVFSSTPGAPETTVPASSSTAFQFNAGAAAGFPVKASASTTPAAPTTNGFQFNAGAAAGFPVKPAATTPIFPANAAVPKFNMGAKPPAAPASTRYSSRPRSGFNSSAPPPPPANLTSPAPSALTPSAVPSASSTPANPFGPFGAANGAMNGAASPFAFGAAATPGAFQFGAASPNPAQAAAAGGPSFFGAK